MLVFVWMWVCVHECSGHRGQKRTGSPGTEIIGDSELPKVGAGNQNHAALVFAESCP